jgi:hypothetical protein
MIRTKEEQLEIDIKTKLRRPYTIVWENGIPFKKSEIWKIDVIEKLEFLYEYRNVVFGSEKQYKEVTQEIKMWEKYLEKLDR